ncbi:SLBB domain-containing protein [Tunturiibacter gelidoferens]|uniref:Protein involved in polysaccharide export with SLBB domain n=1 Tax=Tunturiibacter gelidiferens TaxID=3069689 RepID=A0A9X0QAK9_9BACT|nr:SLBB domain-containing protein [Edaphobacter lichenicola]MBB5326832.1 protein involved in polysaccharide export with SLBB domain [Edaphobacter lichenicola]
MQFGSSPRVCRFGFVFLFTVFGTLTSSAQLDQFGQGLGGGQLGQQPSCDPNDPTCQSSDPGSFQTRNPSSNQQQQNSTPQIIVPGQDTTQTNTQNNLQNQQQNQNQLTRLPLDSPTEFQLLVANSIGKMLPIYGVNLFRNLPSTFAPVNLVPVTPDYVVGPGDELIIQMWGQVTLNGRFLVDRSGSIFVPQVGSIHVAGVKSDQMHDFLKSQVSRVFRNFDLSVNLGQLRSIQVFVVGQARRPGSYTISSLSTLTNALFATGGPSPQGSLRHIQLKREGKVVVDFDLYDLLLRGDKSKDEKLLPGDVIYIPPAGPQIAVSGSVNKPAIYELKSQGDTTMDDALELAAGLSNVASRQRVRLERVDDHRRRSMTEVSLDARGRATVMQDGDLLEVDAVVSQYRDAVTLRGNVANPGRYTWKPGMRVRDLLPDKDALITRDYWLKRSQLGQPTLTYIPTCLPLTPYGIPNLRYGIAVGEEGLNPNWRYSSTRNPNLIGLAFGNEEGSSYRTPDQDANGDADASTDGGLDCMKIPASQTALGGSNDRYVPSAAANAATGTNANGSNNQNANTGSNSNTSASTLPQNGFPGTQQPPSNRISAASASLGSTVENSSAGQFRPKNNVKLGEPDIDWSYAVVERQSKETLTTSLLPFNLGKVVLGGDSTQDLELLPGDVVTVFSKADISVPQEQQTRFVRLDGEFASSGVYSVQPGETLRHLVERAGGFTSEAYLYGSEFTRESTRRVQQARLNQYVDEIALQVSTNATNNAGRAISASDTAAATAAQAQNQNIIASLRQVRSTGRIVLDLKPASHDLSQIPDLPLEDGDRFIVPRVPSTVSVDGAVYNQNSFVFDQERRLGGYIRLAGGTNRDADKSRAYVIRASGSVISKQYSSSLRGNNFDSLHLYPGDTVVVPLNLTKGNTIRLIVDIAQIVGQFGIAIAAATVVF